MRRLLGGTDAAGPWTAPATFVQQGIRGSSGGSLFILGFVS